MARIALKHGRNICRHIDKMMFAMLGQNHSKKETNERKNGVKFCLKNGANIHKILYVGIQFEKIFKRKCNVKRMRFKQYIK